MQNMILKRNRQAYKHTTNRTEFLTFVIVTGISGRACAVICQCSVDAGPAMLTRDVMTVVNIDVTSVSAEAGMTEAHWTSIMYDTARGVYSTG